MLALHGLTGQPAVLGPLPERLRAAGFPVSTPTLPGHGATPAQLAETSWADWSGAVDRALDELLRSARGVVAIGLSMGGTLALWLAAHRVEVVGVVTVNAPAQPQPDLILHLERERAAGMRAIEPFGQDVADTSVQPPDYGSCPIGAMLELLYAIEELQLGLPHVTCPALLVASETDNVIPAMAHREHLELRLGGPVSTLDLARSRHLATIDYDRDLIADAALDFARALDAPAT